MSRIPSSNTVQGPNGEATVNTKNPASSEPKSDDPNAVVHSDAIADKASPRASPTPATSPSVYPTDLTLVPPGQLAPIRRGEGTGKIKSRSSSTVELFDYVGDKQEAAKRNRPGYWAGIARGAQWKPVFSEASDGFSLGAAGNWIVDEVGEHLSNLIHSEISFGHTQALSRDATMSFMAKGRIVPEANIGPEDPRRYGLADIDAEASGTRPVWVAGSIDGQIGWQTGHHVSVGGLNLGFGLSLRAGSSIEMERLVYPGGESSEPGKDTQLDRLALNPLQPKDVMRMEIGARYRFKGEGNYRIDGALGIGSQVSTLGGILKVGAGAQLGVYNSLSGSFDVEIQRLPDKRTRLTCRTAKNSQHGANIKLWAGVEDIKWQEVKDLLRSLSGILGSGGTIGAFKETLSSERERHLANNMGGYLKLFAKHLAEGMTRQVIEEALIAYASTFMKACAGTSVQSDFRLAVDFEFDNPNMVTLPRADMVPEALRGGKGPDEPVEVEAGALARLAYRFAVKGDMRLVQHYCLIRGSGVRIDEELSTETKETSTESAIRLPFFDYRKRVSSSHTASERITAELGHIHTSIDAFNRDYDGWFGDQEQSRAEVRVHMPEGGEQSTVFVGSEDNFSTDWVVENKIEARTNFAEMQMLMGAIDVLSKGRLEDKLEEALRQGAYRNDGLEEHLNLIHQIFFKPSEYGRTITHMHIWLGEAGLKQLLAQNWTEDQLYHRLAQSFVRLSDDGQKQAPAWSEPALRRRMLKSDKLPADLAGAHYLATNLMRIRSQMKGLMTPAKEKKIAAQMRDFLRDAKDSLPAFTALATLVDEEHRAVEMRFTSLRKGEVPTRFTYIQDSRNSELLYAAGVARVAMQQYRRYRSMLDVETRCRLGRLLVDLHQALNAPSPDPYVLTNIIHALEPEFKRMDTRAAEVEDRILSDLGATRSLLDDFPTADDIVSVWPTPKGRKLADLLRRTHHLLAAPQQDLFLLRSVVREINRDLPLLRRLTTAQPLIGSLSRLEPALDLSDAQNAQIQEALERLGTTIEEGGVEYSQALDILIDIHRSWLMNAEVTVESTHKKATVDQSPQSRQHTNKEDHAQPQTSSRSPFEEARIAQGATLAASGTIADKAAISYFERTGAIPVFFMGTPYAVDDNGIIKGSTVTRADLDKAMNRPRFELSAPPLGEATLETLQLLADKGPPSTLLQKLESLSFNPERLLDGPKATFLEYFFLDIPLAERASFLKNFTPHRRSKLEKLYSVLDSQTQREHRLTQAYEREKRQFFRWDKLYSDDRDYLADLLKTDPGMLEPTLNELGYGRVIDTSDVGKTARLEQMFHQWDGDKLNAWVGQLSPDEQVRFYGLVASSDLSPRTRARLAGTIVDNPLLWRQEERLVEALVTGLDGAQLRLLFDQLYADDKLEDFLAPHSFWETLLVFLTLGLARLWLHDNEAALRVVASHGWSPDEVQTNYYGQTLAQDHWFKRAEEVWFDSSMKTIPMPAQMRGALRALHQVVGKAKYYHLSELPNEAGRMLIEMGKGAARQLANRIGDIARQGDNPKAILEEYSRFLKGFSPEAIEQQLKTGDTDGTVAVIAKALGDGLLAGLIEHAQDPRSRFFSMDVLQELIKINNQWDEGVFLSTGSTDARIDAQDQKELLEKLTFFKRYTGFNGEDLELMLGGWATGAAAVTMGHTVSLSTEAAPLREGQVTLSDHMQQIVAFHECVHIVQQAIYGGRLNAFIDQGLHVHSGQSRNGAYAVSEQMFDAADSIHDFEHHWEQQAELLEQGLRLLWQQSRSLKTTEPRLIEAYVPGLTLDVGGERIDLTPDRWAKMVAFVHEFGKASRSALAATGGHFEIHGSH
jgi:hypothetical protein